MIIKRERLELEDLLKNKSKMDKLHPLLRKQIFDFCRNSYKLKRKETKIERLKSSIKKEQILMRNISKELTKEYWFIKDELSIGRPSIYIGTEMKGKSYRLDIDYNGKRRKLTLGKSLKELNVLCKKHYKKDIEKLTDSNWKVLLKKYLRTYITLKVSSVKRDEFELCRKIIIDKTTLEVKFLPKIDETEKKKDKSFRPPPTIDMVVENSSGKVSNGGGSLSKNNQKYSVNRPFRDRGNTFYDSDKRYEVKEGKKLSFKRKKK